MIPITRIWRKKKKSKQKNVDHIQYFKEEEEIAKPNIKDNNNAAEIQNLKEEEKKINVKNLENQK